MPKKRAPIESSIADLHVHLKSNAPFSLEGLPGEAWKCLCVVAWKRLEASNPRWTEVLHNEFWNMQLTWMSSGHVRKGEYTGNKESLLRYGGDVDKAWMSEAFQHMMKTSLKKGQKPLANPRHILEDYERIVSAVSAIRKENPGIGKKPLIEREKFWRRKLQSILDRQPCRDNTKTHAKVSEEILSRAAHESAPSSELALEILRHLDGLSPSTLKKKLFPKLKKTPFSPLEIWRLKA